MVQVFVNETQVSIGQRIDTPSIDSLKIISQGHAIVPADQGKLIANWFYDLSQKCDGVITFNGVIMSKSDVKPYKG